MKLKCKSSPVRIANKKAFFDYFIEEKLVCGISLQGWEVKGIRAGHANLRDSWVEIKNGELYIHGFDISAVTSGGFSSMGMEGKRVRKLLAHKSEIHDFDMSLKLKGYTLIPLAVFFEHIYVKVEIALCKGKKTFDKRESLKLKSIEKSNKRDVKEMRF